ncbi:hypothetical protein D3C85_98840 [compost metagenome]
MTGASSRGPPISWYRSSSHPEQIRSRQAPYIVGAYFLYSMPSYLNTLFAIDHFKKRHPGGSGPGSRPGKKLRLS